MKNLGTLILLLFVSMTSLAQKQTISGGEFNLKQLDSVGDINSIMLNPKAMNTKHILTLEVNPSLLPKNANLPFSISIEFEIQYGNSLLAVNTENRIVSINYSGTGQFKSKDAFVKENVKVVKYFVSSIKINGNIIPKTDLNKYDNLVVIRQQLQYDLFKEPIITDRIQTQKITVTSDKGYAQFSWKPIDWAIAYDIEYTFVDYYSNLMDDDSSLPLPRGLSVPSVPYDFRNNATRIQVKDTQYDIPLIYEKGYLVFRVRPIGIAGKNHDKFVSGQWSVEDFGNRLPYFTIWWSTIVSEGFTFITIDKITHEKDKKNWQYISTFAEEGKRKDVVSYLDGTLRNRQNVTNLSTNNSVLVGETIYDFNGRPAIETLPTPITSIEPNGRVSIQYFQNLNVNSISKPYSRTDFDINRNCLPFPNPFSNIKGAGKYYSDNHGLTFNELSYIPDAEGYPFIQKEYTPDNTGRIKRQSAAGKTHRLGDKDSGTHEQKYSYSTPAQEELDRLFGNDAGINSYYQKETKIDENGQAYFSIKDLRDKVVASGLVGNSPSNVIPIEAIPSKEINIDLVADNNRRDDETNSIVSSYNIVLSDPTNLKFTYSFSNSGLPFKNCDATQSLCYDCVYDLSIAIKNDCDSLIFKKVEKIGTLNNLLNCENGKAQFSFSSTFSLTKGSYTISKNLKVNEDAVNQYVSDYMANSVCWDGYLTKLIPEMAAKNPDPCPVLAECPPLPPISIDHTTPIAGVALPPIDKLPAPTTQQTNCIPKKDTTTCGSLFKKMLADVSPGGQYAAYKNLLGNVTTQIDTFKLSILNVSNSLFTHGNWKKPATHYRNADGTVSMVLNAAGDSVSPENLTDWKDFVKYWQPNWAYSLVMYHPEICLYDWCRNHEPWNSFESEIKKVKSYAVAIVKYPSLFNDPNYHTPEPSDPLMSDAASRIKMIAYMDNIIPAFLTTRPSTNSKKLFELAAISAAGFSKNIDKSLIDNYLRNHAIYSDPDSVFRNEEWNQFKTYYLMARTKIIEEIRHNEVFLSCVKDSIIFSIGDSLCTSNPSCLYKDKTPVFPSQKQVNDVSKYGATTSIINNATGGNEQSDPCGNCSDAQKVKLFLNQLVAERKLLGNFPIRGSLVAMVGTASTDLFISSGDHLNWNGTLITNDHFTGTISSSSSFRGETVIGDLNLIKNPVRSSPTKPLDWNTILGFSCLHVPIDSISDSGSSNDFTIKVFDVDGHAYDFIGYVTWQKMENCSEKLQNIKICTPMPYTYDFVNMLEKILKSIKKQRRNYVIPTQVLFDGRMANSNKLFQQASGIWELENQNIRQRDINDFYIEFSIITPSSSPLVGSMSKSCKIYLRADSDILVNLDTIIGYELIPNLISEDSCSRSLGLLVWAIDKDGNQQSFYVDDNYNNDRFFCFPFGQCCIKPPNDMMCCVPILPKIPVAPAPTCQEIAQTQNGNNARIELEGLKHNLTDSLRQAYIYHCLRPVEKYTLNYTQSIYQVTLSYYDQAGNLTKTVPPKGIKYLNDAEMAQVKQARTNRTAEIVPNHTFATTYEYNTLNAVVKTKSPDAGTTRFCYDELGRIIMSQNEEQKKSADINDRTVSFTNYDDLGRVIQSGELYYYATLPTKRSFADFQKYNIGINDFGGGIYRSKKDVVSIFYDRLPDRIPGGFDINLAKLNQKNLRNRVAATIYHRESGTLEKKYTHANFYSYDIHGNVAVLKQDFRHLANYSSALNLGDSLNFHRIKTINYDYDLISGKVNQVWYQPNQADQFIHRYEYDADNRLVNVKTTTRPWEDTRTIDEDARYKYYLHGPLARIELGREKVQGIDFAYTINGWIKGVNSSDLDPTNDMGKDDGTTVAKDAFAYSLSYFPEDYKAVSGKTFVPALEGTPLTTGFSKPLYNGNIRYMITAIDAFTGYEKIQATAYSYDALNRIKAMQPYRATDANNKFWESGSFSDAYKCSYSYDANGNITSLNRNNDSNVGTKMDELTYSYNTANNQLLKVNDNVGRINITDLDSKNVYGYDAKGRLSTEQESPKNATISTNLQYTWASFDKLRNVNKNGKDIAFEYDAAMHRAFKYNEATKTATYYVNDLQGNPMAIYTFTPDSSHLSEVPLYGSKRLGVLNAHLNLRQTQDKDIKLLSYSRATKQYELSNHLGNVLTTISDRRIRNDTTWIADVQTAQDYYPFGSTMPNRKFKAEKFRYGFNGKENDKDIAGQQDFDNRLFDNRLGRFKGIDPKAAKYQDLSPYNFVGNMPIYAVDKDGRDVVLVIWATHDGKIGHAGIAVSNYATVLEEDVNNNMCVSVSRQVPDGTYTYMDFWPGDGGAGESNFSKDIPGNYQAPKVVTIKDLRNTDVSGGEVEGRGRNERHLAPDGLLLFKTSFQDDKTTQRALDNYKVRNPMYNGLSNNCSDFVRAGLEAALKTDLPADELLTKTYSATTPNHLYSVSASLPTAQVLKDPGNKVDHGFIEGVKGGIKYRGAVKREK